MQQRQSSFKPPIAVAQQAALGLMLRKKFKRGGTMVGIARARDLKNRRNISVQTIRRMYSFFARHFIDKQGRNFYNEITPSNGKIAWLLWGGDPGAMWVTAIYRKLKEYKKL